MEVSGPRENGPAIARLSLRRRRRPEAVSHLNLLSEEGAIQMQRT